MLAPEIFTKKIEREMMRAFDKLDSLPAIREEAKAEGAWPDWAALPTGAGYAAVCIHHGITSLNSPRHTEEIMYAESAYLWRKSKQIFAFDETLEKELIEQDFPGDIPGDVLLRLPVPCVYVQLHASSRIFDSDVPADGFFAYMTWNAQFQQSELTVIALDIDGNSIDRDICPLKGTVEEAVRNIRHTSVVQYMRDIDKAAGYEPNFFEQVLAEVANYSGSATAFKKIFNLLLYLCTDEPDYDNQPRRVKAKPTYTTYTPERPPRRTNITNVGTRIGAAIRLDRQKAKEINDEAEQQQPEHRKHASPIAHIRRGHYHSFWTGAKESVDRKIVVKWLPPMLINGDKGEIVPTIRPVK